MGEEIQNKKILNYLMMRQIIPQIIMYYRKKNE